MDPNDALRQDDVVGAVLVAVAAWVSSITSHPRFYIIPNEPRLHSASNTRIRIARATAIVAAAVVHFVALAQTPLVLVGGTYTTAFVVFTAAQAFRAPPTDLVTNVGWSAVMVSGVVIVACALVSDAHITSAMIRARVTPASVGTHLLVVVAAIAIVLLWIHETQYAFATKQSWTRHVRCLLADPQETASAMRARAFAVASGVAAGTAVVSAKCVAGLVRTNEGSLELPLVVFLACVWLVMTALEAYLWQCAIATDPPSALPLVRPYLVVRMGIQVLEGAVGFTDIHPHRTFIAGAGVIAILLGLGCLSLPEPIAPKCDDDAPAPLLLDATESLLDANDYPASPTAAHVNDNGRNYRPPIHYRALA